jgi:two-component system NtrC family sensor kinase
LRDLDEDAALRRILEGTARETGTQFFAALVKQLAQALGTYGAWVTEYLEESRQLRPFSLWFGGEWIEHDDFDLPGTPCQAVIDGACLLHIPDRVVELYPSQELTALGAVSYLGVPLVDLDGNILGHLAVLDTRPMPEEPKSLALFEIFGARAAAELQRLRAESELRVKNEQLEQLLDELRATQARLIQSEKLAALGQLVAGVAHEVNTPLGAMQSAQASLRKATSKLRNLLDSDADRAKLPAMLKVIDSSANVIETGGDRIDAIVKRMRSFARLDQSDTQHIDVTECIEDALALVAYRLSGITVERQLGELPKISCYPRQLNQLLANVLVNAADAIEGAGTVVVRSRVAEDAIEILVVDDGVGIAPKDLDRVFDPGFTTKGVGVGAGLGLAISHRIADEHGGSIAVQSEHGTGTTVIVRLPLEASESSRD